jgi:hypothetical protein
MENIWKKTGKRRTAGGKRTSTVLKGEHLKRDVFVENDKK